MRHFKATVAQGFGGFQGQGAAATDHHAPGLAQELLYCLVVGHSAQGCHAAQIHAGTTQTTGTRATREQ